MFFISFNIKTLLNVISYPILLTFLIISIYLFVIKRKARKEIDEFTLSERIKKFKPRPIIETYEKDFKEIPLKNTKFNFVKIDYLSFSQNQDVIDGVSTCIRKYGVGTCGPRGFLGTTDVHLLLETKLCEFIHTEDAIVYSYGFTAVSSSVACYCKPEDVIFVDELCNAAISHGVQGTKSKIFYFKHNNPVDFLKLVKSLNFARTKVKKIIVLEGIYARDGSICRLNEFVPICKEYKIRIFLDECISFGTLGKTGRGITEYFDIDIADIDLIIGSLEYALYSIGGFCVARNHIVEHQRLHSLGYVYSASLPTYLAKAAVLALENIKNKPLILRLLSIRIDNFLRSLGVFNIKSHSESPLKVFSANVKRKVIFAHKFRDFLQERDVYVIVENENIKMNLYVDFGKKDSNLEELFNIFRRGIKECV